MDLHDILSSRTSTIDHYRLFGIAQTIVIHDIFISDTSSIIRLGQNPVTIGIVWGYWLGFRVWFGLRVRLWIRTRHALLADYQFCSVVTEIDIPIAVAGVYLH